MKGKSPIEKAGPALDGFVKAMKASKRSRIGPWHKCEKCHKETWQTRDGECIKCNPSIFNHQQ